MSKVKEKHSDLGSLFGQIWRQSGWLFLLLLVLCVAPFVLCAAPDGFSERLKGMGASLYKLLCLTIFLLLIIKICRSLTDYFSLKRNENGITWCQISILIVIFLWGIAFLLIFDIHKESRNFLVLGIVGTLLGWIFQDTIKGVVAFIHLRLNHLLCIDDWIVVPKHNVDGVVKHITLTTVTVYNWDTTTSSIPTSVLHTDHFINYEKMSRGKTYGRQMLKSFIIDTSCFHPLSLEEAESLRKNQELQPYLSLEDIKEGVLNAQLYRLYVYHWLMNHPCVSQKPFLIVRWLEQKEAGMPLEVFAFIMEGGFTAFEWQQSQIMEHLMKALDWFALRLYQAPSSRDVSNGILHLGNQGQRLEKEVEP